MMHVDVLCGLCRMQQCVGGKRSSLLQALSKSFTQSRGRAPEREAPAAKARPMSAWRRRTCAGDLAAYPVEVYGRSSSMPPRLSSVTGVPPDRDCLSLCNPLTGLTLGPFPQLSRGA